MNGTIDVLNVGDGDAIIITLTKNDRSLIVVIDGGEMGHYESKVKPALVKRLKEKHKVAPDIVVATHFDSDHIGGLIPLISDYINDIKEVWVHRQPELLCAEVALQMNDLNGELHSQTYIEENFSDKNLISNSSFSKDAIVEKSNIIIESLKQLNTFLGNIPADKVKHVYSGYSFKGWPELTVLGPTESFYKSLFPDRKTLSELILEETVDYIDEKSFIYLKRFEELVEYNNYPCSDLKNDSSAKLTTTNKASIIILIENNKKKYLFTGDAGVSSFKAIPDWENKLADLYWLKIPHHGSKNNISNEIINIIRPIFADNSGNRYQDNQVLDCIAGNCRSMQYPRSTKSEYDLMFQIL